MPQAIGLAVYVISGALIVGVAESYRRAIRHLDEQEGQRIFFLRELQHRSANTLAVVQAIVSQTLRGNKEDAEKINRRIRALAATNDLLTQSKDQTADLKDVLLTELKPYGFTRIVVQGGVVNLAPALATALALIFHELAANAAKYGALSRPEGRLSVFWAITGRKVQITWAEKDGPPVVASATRGFGTILLEHILDSFQGKVEIELRPDGLWCVVSFDVPKAELQDSLLPDMPSYHRFQSSPSRKG